MKKIIKYLKENWILHGFETLAVIIGILGAFGLNNWAELRKEEKLEIQYLRSLIFDLSQDTIYYNKRIIDSKIVVERHSSFIKQAYDKQESFEEAMALLRIPDWNSEHLTNQNFTYIELRNSQDLNIFKNSDLKNSIISYYRQVEQVGAHMKEFNETSALSLVEISSVVRNYIKLFGANSHIYDHSMLETVDWKFVNNPESDEFQTIENTSNIYLFKHQVFLGHFTDLKQEAEQLINQIQKELEG